MSSKSAIRRLWPRHWRLRPAILAGVVLSLSASTAQAGQDCAKVQHVKEWDFLFIRARPDHRSRALGAIDPSTTGQITLNGPCVPPGAPPRAAWCPVSYQVSKDVSITGYVKKYYISIGECGG